VDDFGLEKTCAQQKEHAEEHGQHAGGQAFTVRGDCAYRIGVCMSRIPTVLARRSSLQRR